MNHGHLFEDLFVLELANNHWGRVDRGLKIVTDYSRIVRFNNVKAAIKLQFRDVDHFISPSFKGREDLRYVKKTEATKLEKHEYATLINDEMGPSYWVADFDAAERMLTHFIRKAHKRSGWLRPRVVIGDRPLDPQVGHDHVGGGRGVGRRIARGRHEPDPRHRGAKRQRHRPRRRDRGRLHPAQSISCSLKRCSLPVWVRGSLSTNSTARGYL